MTCDMDHLRQIAVEFESASTSMVTTSFAAGYRRKAQTLRDAIAELRCLRVEHAIISQRCEKLNAKLDELRDIVVKYKELVQ